MTHFIGGGRIPLVLAVSMYAVIGSGLRAATLDFSTSTPANWSITAGGAVNATPYPFGGEISVTTTGTGVGTFVPGGSFSNFDGFWLAQYVFSLPSDAASISLTFSNLTADDRVLLTLNGTPLAATGIS